MMRSMYAAVSGLKTHQTKMDVIGNNIANVNTVAFKSSSVTFRDILYQTTAGASGANAQNGIGGVNAKQIGLGVSMAATSTSIETSGASETTGNPFDIRLTDKNSTNFFIVNDGTQNLFTRAGSFYVDGVGNLCMTSTGYTVMGWQVDETTNEIRKDTVSALRIMQEKNLTSAPEATSQAVMGGVIDKNDTDVKSDAGKIMNLNFYDSLGYQYTARFSLKSTDKEGVYKISLSSILDENNNNLLDGMSAEEVSQLFGAADEIVDTTDLTLNASSVTGGDANATAAFDAAGNLVVTTTTTDDTDPDNPVTTTTTATYSYDSKTNQFVNTEDETDTLSLEQVFGSNADFEKIGAEDLEAGESYAIVFDETTGAYQMTHTYLALDSETQKVFSAEDIADPDNITLNEDGSIKQNGVTYTFDGTKFVDATGTNTLEITDVFNVTETMQGYLGIGMYDDGSKASQDYSFQYSKEDGAYTITKKVATYEMEFNTSSGKFENINNDPKGVTLKLGDAVGGLNVKGNFSNIDIDFTQCLSYNNGGKSTVGMDSGATDGTTGKGRKLGSMIGISINPDGKIYGSYDNGNTELLGQIAVAQFSNASGLSKLGDSCYQTTLNSGDFDGIGVEISADGSTMTTGELEMSNVDLSTEFTQMITTQRGFQANSRVITTSDTLLEELVNLKR